MLYQWDIEYADYAPAEASDTLKKGMICELHLTAFKDEASVLEIWGLWFGLVG